MRRWSTTRRSRSAAAVATGALVVGALVSALWLPDRGDQAHADVIAAQSWYTFEATAGVFAGACIDVKKGVPADGAPLQTYTCNGNDAQRWVLTQDAGNNATTLHSVIRADRDGDGAMAEMCLDPVGGGKTQGTALQLAFCNGLNFQTFTLEGEKDDKGNVVGALKNTPSGLCVQIRDKDRKDNAALELWPCTDKEDQQFTAKFHTAAAATATATPTATAGPVPTGPTAQYAAPVTLATYTTFSVKTGALAGRCIDIPSGNATDGRQVQLYQCNGEQAQNFFFSPATGADPAAPSGSVHSVLRGGTGQAPTDLCLDAQTANDGVSLLQLANCNGSAQQTFTLTADGGNVKTADAAVALSTGTGTSKQCVTGDSGHPLNGNARLVLASCDRTDDNRFTVANKPSGN